MIAKNILFNAIGGCWLLAVSVLAVPVQMRLLGVESYGVIGFLASLQAVLQILDLGLPTMVIRKVAAEQRLAESTVRAAAGIYTIIGVAAGCAWIVLSPLLNDIFLAPPAAHRHAVIVALQLCGFAFAIRWPVAVYSGLLSGLQRMDATNLLRAGSATIRNLGACAALWFLPDIRVFAGWMILAGIAELFAHLWICRRAWLGFNVLPTFRLAPLAGTWAFSAGMVLFSAESIAMVQSDRLVVARSCGLQEFGHYSAAWAFAFSLAILQGFITSALLPALAADNDRQRGTERREAATEMLMLIMSVPGMALVVMGTPLLSFLFHPADAQAISAPLAGLALGCLVNSSLGIAVTDTIATGRLRGILLTNLVSWPLYLLTLIILVRLYGSVGASIGWLLLNLSYLISVPFALDRGDDHPDSMRLVLRCSAPYWLSAGFWFIGAQSLVPSTPWWTLIAFIGASMLHLISGWLVLTPRTKSMATHLCRGLLFR